MSDDVLSIIPTDPQWQPGRDAAGRVVSLVEELTPGVVDGVEVEIDVMWHDVVTVSRSGTRTPLVQYGRADDTCG
ncbi:hypothetical protein SAZ11_60075 [Streptomyces sp. FXJ1.4098]|uniref:hypothetical protein n=1 Tax=Streptomyces sp. NPDC020845 TaxID=3365096 RepID=UPI0029919A70|nr:hypothetical protein [Streptomyces sp. FXJ1.4098]